MRTKTSEAPPSTRVILQAFSATPSIVREHSGDHSGIRSVKDIPGQHLDSRVLRLTWRQLISLEHHASQVRGPWKWVVIKKRYVHTKGRRALSSVLVTALVPEETCGSDRIAAQIVVGLGYNLYSPRRSSLPTRTTSVAGIDRDALGLGLSKLQRVLDHTPFELLLCKHRSLTRIFEREERILNMSQANLVFR